MGETSGTQMMVCARLAAAHAAGDQAALAGELRAAHRAGVEWDTCYEVLLQLVAYTGYPRTLNAMATFRAVSGIAAGEQPSEPWESHATAVWPERGIAIFHALWPGHALADSVRPLSPELAEWVIYDDFGRIFGRPGLTLLEREAAVIGSLVGQGTTPQLRSHRLAFLAVGGDDAAIDTLVSGLADILPTAALESARQALATFRAE
jgi:4-carboxymuconolactone decarboxylase